MHAQMPNALLEILEFWLCECYSCVKWHNASSRRRYFIDIRFCLSGRLKTREWKTRHDVAPSIHTLMFKYGLDACYLTKYQLNLLDFVINRLFTKLFKTYNMDIVKV